MSAELLPCPFCGGSDVAMRTRKTTILECNGCHAFMFDYHDGVKRSVIEAWNTRATQPQAPQGGVTELTPEQIDKAYRDVWSTVPHAHRLTAFAHAIFALATPTKTPEAGK